MFIYYRLPVGHGLFVPASGRQERFLRLARDVFAPSCTRRAWNLLEGGVQVDTIMSEIDIFVSSTGAEVSWYSPNGMRCQMCLFRRTVTMAPWWASSQY